MASWKQIATIEELQDASTTLNLDSLIIGSSQESANSITITDVGSNMQFIFEGPADDHETTLNVVNPTADNLINLPDGSGTLALAESLTQQNFSGGLSAAYISTKTSTDAANGVLMSANSIIFEGSNADDYEVALRAKEASEEDRIIYLPNESGDIALQNNSNHGRGFIKSAYGGGASNLFTDSIMQTFFSRNGVLSETHIVTSTSTSDTSASAKYNIITAANVADSEVHLQASSQDGDALIQFKSQVTGSGAAAIKFEIDGNVINVPTTAGTLALDGNGTLDWTQDQGATNIDPGNYINTTYTVGDGGLTQKNFTTALNTKLTGIEDNATADQTGAEIKTAYEAESDTNAFTDTLLSKLNAIEASATADQTGAEIKSAYEGEADTNAFTDARATKLGNIADGAQVNVQSDWNAASGDAFINNKPTIQYTSAIPDATASQTGLATSTQITKLDGIAAGAEENVQSDWDASSGDAQILNKPTIPSGNQIIDWTTDTSNHLQCGTFSVGNVGDSNSVVITDNTITFEGSTDDGDELALVCADPTADRTITIPDATGTIAIKNVAGDFDMTDGNITNVDNIILTEQASEHSTGVASGSAWLYGLNVGDRLYYKVNSNGTGAGYEITMQDRGYRYEYIVCNYNTTSAGIKYLPLCSYVIEQSSNISSNREYTSMVAPHDGTFHKIFWRASAEQDGNGALSFYRGSDTDSSPALEFRTRLNSWTLAEDTTYENVIGTTTSGDIGLTDNTFSKGDVIVIAFDPADAPGDVNCTVVLKYDIGT